MAKLRSNTAKIWTKGYALGTFLLLAILLAGCSGIGPKTVTRDRLEYVSAISDSWKRQVLLNLLKTRYMDAPIFLEIASVINQYSVEREFGLGASDVLSYPSRGSAVCFEEEPTCESKRGGASKS
jgi:hypothetical protein